MEHRYCQRITASIPVAIRSGDTWVALGVIRNLCHCGFFIEAQVPSLHEGQILHVRFLANPKLPALPDSPWEVLVTHQNSRGFGAWLGEHRFDEDTRLDCLVAYLSGNYRKARVPLGLTG